MINSFFLKVFICAVVGAVSATPALAKGAEKSVKIGGYTFTVPASVEIFHRNKAVYFRTEKKYSVTVLNLQRSVRPSEVGQMIRIFENDDKINQRKRVKTTLDRDKRTGRVIHTVFSTKLITKNGATKEGNLIQTFIYGKTSLLIMCGAFPDFKVTSKVQKLKTMLIKQVRSQTGGAFIRHSKPVAGRVLDLPLKLNLSSLALSRKDQNGSADPGIVSKESNPSKRKTFAGRFQILPTKTNRQA